MCFHRICSDKKAKIAFNGFIGAANKSKRQQNKLWMDQKRKLYSNLMQKWLHDYVISISSTHNESTSVAAVRFMRTLKSKIY